MKNIFKDHSAFVSESDKKAIKEDDGITTMQKKEKLLSIGVYTLIIIITIALMLILFNLIIIG